MSVLEIQICSVLIYPGVKKGGPCAASEYKSANKGYIFLCGLSCPVEPRVQFRTECSLKCPA